MLLGNDFAELSVAAADLTVGILTVARHLFIFISVWLLLTTLYERTRNTSEDISHVCCNTNVLDLLLVSLDFPRLRFTSPKYEK